jgi:C-terminal processing protease CtpA/Prc
MSIVQRWGRRVLLVGFATGLPSSSPLHEPVDTVLDTGIDTEFVNGSRIEIDSLSPTELDNLVVLAKVWGFLKYHHPRVTSGEQHWDFELFRVLPSVLAASDAMERNAALLDWIEGLGSVPICVECASPPTDVHLQPPIDWIHDEALLGAELSVTLEHVWQNRPTGAQFWVWRDFASAGNASFDREPPYTKLEHVDTGYRMLAAFRLWNIIQYWFPYRDQIDESWDAVLRELLPVFVEAHEHEAYERALLRLVARVHDGHANIWTALDARPPLGPCALPAHFRFLDHQAVVTWVSSKFELQLQVGDILLALDHEPMDELLEAWRPYYAASNEPTRLHDIAQTLSRGECGRFPAIVDRSGHELELELERVSSDRLQSMPAAHDRPGDTFQWLGDDVAYITLSSIETDDIPGYIEAILGKRGLVIDIRNYPREFVPFALGQHFVDVPTPFARTTDPDFSNPGAFTWTDTSELSPQAPHYAGTIVILVDETSISQSEWTAMAFRAAPKSIVIGSTTAGADGNVSGIILPGGEQTAISGIGVFYPDKRPTQRIGIVPDITVIPTREGIQEGRDEVLERALREILGPDVPDDQIRELARPPSK